VVTSGHLPANSSVINVVTIMGLDESPSEVVLNDETLQDDSWEWHNDTMVGHGGVYNIIIVPLQVLVVKANITNINEPFLLEWD